jgi:hypothetical protein
VIFAYHPHWCTVIGTSESVRWLDRQVLHPQFPDVAGKSVEIGCKVFVRSRSPVAGVPGLHGVNR